MKALLSSVLLSGLVACVWGGTLQRQVKECGENIGAKASRRFAYELYAQAAAESNSTANVFLAPTTVASALAMVLMGAKGDTKEQIWQGMKFSERYTVDDLPCLSRTFSDEYEEGSEQEKIPSNPLELRSAQRLFGEQSFPFNENFIGKSALYGAQMHEVDFANDPQGSRTYINNWVAQVTEDKIQDLFSQDDITANTVLAITSAIYFKGQWQTEFDPKNTKKRNFSVSEDKVVQADFMSQVASVRTSYSTSLNANLMELPYQADIAGKYNVSMVIVVPESMASLEKKVTEQHLSPEIQNLFKINRFGYRISMPKFKMAGDYKLKSMLQNMGMTDMFDQTLANLTGMRNPTNTNVANLYVGSAVHKTFIEVDEKGTEASGATGIVIWARSRIPSFECDRPFLTIIYEKNSRRILFIGRINDPTAE